MKVPRLLLFIVFLTTFTSFVIARPVRLVSYQELFDKSDLVVIATPKATSDTKERIDLPGISVTNADNTRNGLSVIGIETKFHISVVLKGDQTIKDFTLHHYREATKPLRVLSAL